SLGALAQFDARVQRTKNRLVAIPANVKNVLGLTRRAGDRLIHVSIRKASQGRWCSHYFKLTEDNEFTIPSDVVGLCAGDRIEVKVHEILSAAPTSLAGTGAGARALLLLAERQRPGWRRDGSKRIEDYLNEAIHGEGRPR
ncbi:MAG TPA: hypothetical protein VF395_03820, partial [Polyangiaceae bacterium]